MPKIEKRLTAELRRTFPEDFLWGASISAHQVEGDTYNQWTKWEQEHAVESAQLAEERWSWIPAWGNVRTLAKNPENYISGHGVQHYKQFEQDFKILKALGLNTFRFSIEWSRIEPEEGTFNLEALKYYKEYIDTLNKMGVTPIIGLWHWTNPVWFEQKGGFSKRRNLKHWQAYIEKVADELDWTDIEYVLTLNEANTYIGMSYLLGEFPHYSRSKLRALNSYSVLLKAHKIAYRILKLHHPHLNIGIAHQVAKVVPKNDKKIIDKMNAWLYAYFMQWWFLGRAVRTMDYLGLNYYFTDYRAGLTTFPSNNPPHPLNDLGWYMEPSGIEHAIIEADRRLKKPIIITENGLADMRDENRLWWITETIHAIESARRQGAKVIGYCHWSLLDNFEWQFGWFPKFGLVAVDRETYKRKVKSSAKAWGRWLHIK